MAISTSRVSKIIVYFGSRLHKILNLLSACVDVLSSEGHLNAMNAMEMSQMVVQAMWDRDSPLKQIPHFGPEVVQVANDYKYVPSRPTILIAVAN